MPPTDVDKVLDELETPGVDTLASLRGDTAGSMELLGKIAEQTARLLQRIEHAQITEDDAEALSVLRQIHQKVARARADADEARDKISRAGRALREAQAISKTLYQQQGRSVPDHLEDVPGRTFGPPEPR